jgi:hypothetical protein
VTAAFRIRTITNRPAADRNKGSGGGFRGFTWGARALKGPGIIQVFALSALCLFTLLVLSCTEPVPLYGQWADNQGNSISLFSDGTFVVSVINPRSGDTSPLNYQGDYTILLNVLTFSCTNAMQVVTEWDIRGNMLYIVWPVNTGNLSLTLYKIAN